MGIIIKPIVTEKMTAMGEKYNRYGFRVDPKADKLQIKKAVEEIKYCLDNNISFTQETTLSGHRTEKTIQQARKQGYYVIMYYVGLNSKEESLARIENRVRKGGHDIPKNDVCRRFDNRFDSLKRIVPLCDEVIFYDNENGFIKVAEIKNNKFNYSNGYRPKWITEFENKLKLG